MGYRKIFIMVSVLVLLAGLFSAVARQVTPGGTDAFNLGVDFQGGTLVTVKFREGQVPSEEAVRAALNDVGLTDSVIQGSLTKTDEILIKIPLIEGTETALPPTESPAQPEANTQANANTATSANTNAQANTAVAAQTEAQNNQVNVGRARVKQGLDAFGREAAAALPLEQDAEAAYKIVGTDSVGPVAGEQLRNQAIIATILGLIGILLFIAFRYDWTYAAGAVIAVLHDVLITLAFFTMFQWEVSLSVLAALLTLVGYSTNDTIVIFDRIRENLSLRRTESLYKLTNDSINQTMSRTIVTNGLVFLTVLALVLFGGEVLRGFSLALFVGAITGTFSTIAIASPIAIWWQGKLGAAKMKVPETGGKKEEKLASASRRPVTRRPVTR